MRRFSQFTFFHSLSHTHMRIVEHGCRRATTACLPVSSLFSQFTSDDERLPGWLARDLTKLTAGDIGLLWSVNADGESCLTSLHPAIPLSCRLTSWALANMFVPLHFVTYLLYYSSNCMYTSQKLLVLVDLGGCHPHCMADSVPTI